MDKFIIYSDGSCVGSNPGYGGWAYCIMTPESTDAPFTQNGHCDYETTNNRMELTAAIRSLDNIPHGYSVDMHLDSMYVINGITKWIHGWKKKNYLDVKNADLWMELDAKVRHYNMTWTWVKAHRDNKHNNLVDSLAQDAARKHMRKLYNMGGLPTKEEMPIIQPDQDEEKAIRKFWADRLASVQAPPPLTKKGRQIEKYKKARNKKR